MRGPSKILVTGGAGFIGSHLVDRLLSEEIEVTVLDDFSTGRMQNISHHKNTGELHIIHGDVRDAEVVRNAVEDVEAVFHEAALIDVALSAKEPVLFNDVNVVGTLNLLRACIDSGVRRFVFSSSAAVYGDSGPAKKREDMLPMPASPYGVTKLAAENYVRVFSELYGLETVSLRYFNVYGSRQCVNFSYNSVVTAFLSRLLNGQAPIIHGDGRQTRDLVNVGDVVSANVLALRTKNAVGEVLNIASGRAITINRLARILQRITGMEHLKPIFTEPRVGDIRHCLADTSKAEKLLGFRSKIKISEGLMRLIYEHGNTNDPVK
jgi:nucleoside-diphosphate-sugar epimerase